MYLIKNIRAFNRNRKPVVIPPSIAPKYHTTVVNSPQLQTESIDQFIRRGGQITICKPKLAPKKKISTKLTYTRHQMLELLGF